jgi:sugar/nucleoside kinase (ribokinase family)
MNGKKIIISGTGCALADYLYTGVKFTGREFQKYLSKQSGDGGLSPGKLVFTEELEKFSSKSYADILVEIANGASPCSINNGGPGLVPLIHASQMLDAAEFEVKFYGGCGKDQTSGLLFDLLKNLPLNISNYLEISTKNTPFTHVFSDASYDNNQGERTFINNIGAAWDYSPDLLGSGFFKSDIVCFGGTALVPQIHDNLTELLSKAKKKGCLTVVNTVFDFRNEKKNPGVQWPLGDTDKSLKMIDLLMMDCEEALKISGCQTIDLAADFFISKEVSSFVITNGSKNLFAYSDGRLFEKVDLIQLPVSGKVAEMILQNPDIIGDTTGCGDNFAGGAIASVATQLKLVNRGELDLFQTLAWAVASGGFTCFYIGGTYFEKRPGEKYSKVKELVNDYIKQISIE